LRCYGRRVALFVGRKPLFQKRDATLLILLDFLMARFQLGQRPLEDPEPPFQPRIHGGSNFGLNNRRGWSGYPLQLRPRRLTQILFLVLHGPQAPSHGGKAKALGVTKRPKNPCNSKELLTYSAGWGRWTGAGRPVIRIRARMAAMVVR
jgi:hypothetical protein